MRLNCCYILPYELKTVFQGLLFLCITLLSVAFFIEHVMHAPPCALCLYQRWIYAILSIVSIFGIYIKKSAKVYLKLILLATILAILSGVILSVYHVGIERGIFEPSTICKASIDFFKDTNLENIINKISNQHATSCAKVTFRILKLSLSEWTLIINCGLFMYFFIYILRNKKIRD